MVVRRCAGVLASLLVATQVSAAEPLASSSAPSNAERPPEDSEEPVEVTFRTLATGASLQIDGQHLAASDGRCSTACTLSISPGWYTVHLSVSGKVTSLPVLIRKPSEVTVSAGSPFFRGLGIGLVIVGGSAALVGFLAVSSDPTTQNPSPDPRATFAVVGGLGLFTALLGMGIYLSERPKAKVVTPTETEPRRSAAHRAWRFVIAPSIAPQRATLRVGFAF